MPTYETLMTSDERSPAQKLLISLLPTLLAILVMAGGWVYNFATNAAVLREHERRLATIESNYVPKSVADEKEKAQADHDTDTRQRLDRIETKLDEVTLMLLKQEQGRIDRSKARD